MFNFSKNKTEEKYREYQTLWYQAVIISLKYPESASQKSREEALRDVSSKS